MQYYSNNLYFTSLKRLLMSRLLLLIICLSCSLGVAAQTRADTVAIRQAALDYIESQHRPDPAQMARGVHPLLVKRTFWKHRQSDRQYLMESHSDQMELLAATYNKQGDKFPERPRKEVILLDVSDNTASVKLIADAWIDYMHIVKLNNEWKIVNVLWQFHDAGKHQ